MLPTTPPAHAPQGPRDVRDEELRRLRHRLARAEGQVRGIAHMVEADRECIEILTQINATHAALNGVALAILERRLRAAADEDPTGVEHEALAQELTAAVARLIGR